MSVLIVLSFIYITHTHTHTHTHKKLSHKQAHKTNTHKHIMILLFIYLYIPITGRKEMFYLMTHSTHFIYSYMVSDIWQSTTKIVRYKTRCCHMGYSFQLTARVLLYAPSHRQDCTYHSLCYTSHGSLAGTRNSSSQCSTTGVTITEYIYCCYFWVHVTTRVSSQCLVCSRQKSLADLLYYTLAQFKTNIPGMPGHRGLST